MRRIIRRRRVEKWFVLLPSVWVRSGFSDFLSQSKVVYWELVCRCVFVCKWLSLCLCGDVPNLSRVTTCLRTINDSSSAISVSLLLAFHFRFRQPKSCTTGRRWMRKTHIYLHTNTSREFGVLIVFSTVRRRYGTQRESMQTLVELATFT